MDYFSWLKEFTALIQLISAINFAYIFTHFAQKVYSKIFNEEEFINKQFSSFRNGQLAKVSESIEHMNPIVINGKDTHIHIDSLKSELTIITNRWDKAKEKAQEIIKNFKEVKGVKCLFLYISVYCIIDMLNIAIINVVNIRFFQIFTYLINAMSFIFSIIITYMILRLKWQKKEDIYCYNQTRKFLSYTFIICLFLTIFNEICIILWGIKIEMPTFFTTILLFFCVFLPLYPCLFSVIYIFGNIVYINFFRTKTKTTVLYELRYLNKKKKKLEKAISTITSDLNWE